MKAKKAIGFTREVSDLLLDEFKDIECLDTRTATFAGGFKSAIGLIDMLMDDDDDEEFTAKDAASAVVASCILAMPIVGLIDVMERVLKDED